MIKKLLLLFVILAMLTPSVTAITYRIETDSDYGFYRVRDIDTHTTPDFKNNTLTLKRSDTVQWENFAVPDERLTLVSEEGFWNSTDAVMRWNYQTFSYTFNSVGDFSVHIKEYPRLKMNVIVIGIGGGGGSGTAITTTTYPTTPINWENETENLTDNPNIPAQPISQVPPLTATNVFIFIIGVSMIAILSSWWLKK